MIMAQLDVDTSRNIEDWRAEMAQARRDSVGKPGMYLDRSPTGAGKSYADISAAGLAGSSLTLLHVHDNCGELVAAMKAAGLDAAAYPALDSSSTPRNPISKLQHELRACNMSVAPGAVVGGRLDSHGYGASICCTVGGSATPVAANTLPQVPWASLRNKNRLPSCSTSAYCRFTRSRTTSSHSSL